jgi:predicted HTH domain antitoxin
MAQAKTHDAMMEIDEELSAVVRAGCFANQEEALREAVQTLFAVKPQLRVEAAIQRYLDEEITLRRAAELAGVTRWRFQELLAQRGIRITIEARPSKKLDEAVERIRRRRQ